jgi:hypothetical protein
VRLLGETGSFAGVSFKQKIKTRQGQENKFHKLRSEVRWSYREVQTQHDIRLSGLNLSFFIIFLDARLLDHDADRASDVPANGRRQESRKVYDSSSPKRRTQLLIPNGYAIVYADPDIAQGSVQFSRA